MSRTLALGHAVSFDAEQFIVVDDAERLEVSLISRSPNGALSERRMDDPSVDRLLEVASALGVDHFALHFVDAGSEAVTALLAHLARNWRTPVPVVSALLKWAVPVVAATGTASRNFAS